MARIIQRFVRRGHDKHKDVLSLLHNAIHRGGRIADELVARRRWRSGRAESPTEIGGGRLGHAATLRFRLVIGSDPNGTA